jgi:hypothetical protein
LALATRKEKIEKRNEIKQPTSHLDRRSLPFLSFLIYLFSFLSLLASSLFSLLLFLLSNSSGQNTPASGIYGAMVAAWGNAPANPRSYECVKVYDSSGQRLIATGICSGTFAQFRIPLTPGSYMVDKSLFKGQPGAAPKAQPGSIPVEVQPGRWLNLAPKPPPGPVP